MQTPANIWDVHHHWVAEKDYLPRLLREMDRLGIEKTGLIVMGPLLRDLFVQQNPCDASSHDDLVRQVARHPDRLWAYGYLRPGYCEPRDVDRFCDMGIRALKFHLSLLPYGDEAYFPIYARAAELRMPCLFHTGLFFPPQPMPGQKIRSENYRPIHLEPIAHEFPDLPLIIAHMGVSWNQEAATLCRMFPNIYADLSGRTDGWRSAVSLDRLSQLLYWPDACRKILFGSDVHLSELEDTVGHQASLLARIGWDQNQLQAVFSENARKIFANA